MVWLALYNLTSSGSYIFASLVIFVIKKRTCDSLRSRFRHKLHHPLLIVGSEHITVFAISPAKIDHLLFTTQIGNSSTPLSSLASSSMSSSSLGVGSLRSLSLNSFKPVLCRKKYAQVRGIGVSRSFKRRKALSKSFFATRTSSDSWCVLFRCGNRQRFFNLKEVDVKRRW